MNIEPCFQSYRACLESLTADTTDSLDSHLSDNVHFSDPFHDTSGKEQMKRAIARLFATATNVSFRIDDHATATDIVYFHWCLSAKLRGRDWQVRGVTRLAFDAEGRVTSHEEYWDSASQLYEHFPLIGPLLRYLRRRVAGS